MLWRDLRDRRCLGFKFRRQYSLGTYVVDFVCLEARLVVEVDGPIHDHPDRQTRDLRRDEWLRSQGFDVLRFSNDLFASGSGELPLEAIRRGLRERAADPSSDPASPGHLLPQGEKERLRPTREGRA